MMEIKAIIQPFMLSKVIEALKGIPGMPGITVSEVKGFGHTRAEHVASSVTEWGVNFVPKVKLETVVSDDMLDQVLHAIQQSAYTGNIGDGKIFVYPVRDVVKIRTGERGQKAL